MGRTFTGKQAVGRRLPYAVLAFLLLSGLATVTPAVAAGIPDACEATFLGSSEGLVRGAELEPGDLATFVPDGLPVLPGDILEVQFPAGTTFPSGLSESSFAIHQEASGGCGAGETGGVPTPPSALEVRGTSLLLTIPAEALTKGGDAGQGRLHVTTLASVATNPPCPPGGTDSVVVRLLEAENPLLPLVDGRRPLFMLAGPATFPVVWLNPPITDAAGSSVSVTKTYVVAGTGTDPDTTTLKVVARQGAACLADVSVSLSAPGTT
ncbi:MAG TPA: hypothetical protein VFH47_01215, partial [Candidatus Thermoplasmatota archaeon]|nr:hypothetical protein [Candidatus Thermoplasmatota archaeon]